MSLPPTKTSSSETVLDHLVEHLQSKDLALDGQERPIAILWTDPKAEWRPLVATMQTRVHELLVLGDLSPDDRTGPAVWLRCLVDRVLKEPTLPEGRAPILYLPNVARQDLRAGEQCPDELKPLVELMFRGTLWLQHNGSDWGVSTFLTSSKALGLDIARDQGTHEAMLRALPEIAVTPVAQLRGHRLEADDFDQMLSSDVIRDLLRWMGDPSGTKSRLGDNGWAAFRNLCKEKLDFDPATEADVTAGERMAKGEGDWKRVWARFEEAPTGFPGIEELLRRSAPTDLLLFNRERWPHLNEEDEKALHKAIESLPGLSHSKACLAITELEKAHGLRRTWVWARLGLSPLSHVLDPLARLAKCAHSAIGGSTPDEISATYQERGWEGDAAAWEAVAAATTANEAVVTAAVRHLLLPWLDDSARAFQKAVEHSPLPSTDAQSVVTISENGCVLFCDGLRYDLGRRLGERLEGRGCRVTIGERWAATPTVTATCKPAVSPVAHGIRGRVLEKDFGVHIEKGEKPANAANLRKEIEDSGYQILGVGALDLPLERPARGWLECGEIDSMGHKLKGRLAGQIDAELHRLSERVTNLLELGWESVRIVTDHGWLLVPGGLPKVDLPKHLTESRWARCAVISGEATPDVPRFPWYWNSIQEYATAPGIACFNKSEEYAHGGLSVQECLIPDILVERAGEAVARATIKSVTWRGLRCFIEVIAGVGEVIADLRLGHPAGVSVVATKRTVEDDAVSLVLMGDEHEVARLSLVLLDEAGNVLAHRPTTVGENS